MHTAWAAPCRVLKAGPTFSQLSDNLPTVLFVGRLRMHQYEPSHLITPKIEASYTMHSLDCMSILCVLHHWAHQFDCAGSTFTTQYTQWYADYFSVIDLYADCPPSCSLTVMSWLPVYDIILFRSTTYILLYKLKTIMCTVILLSHNYYFLKTSTFWNEVWMSVKWK